MKWQFIASSIVKRKPVSFSLGKTLASIFNRCALIICGKKSGTYASMKAFIIIVEHVLSNESDMLIVEIILMVLWLET